MKNRAFITVKSLIVVVAACSAIFVGLIFFLPSPNYKKGFENLYELQEFSKTLDEWIKMENKDLLNPVYDYYYESISKASVFRICNEKIKYQLSQLSDKFRPIFSLSAFSNILKENNYLRQSRHQMGDFIQKIVVKEDSKIVVFETLQGAFHSMVRYLQKLNELDIIDSDFKLKNDNFYLIFLGNVFNRAPYNIELFMLILKILQRNPKNAIFIKGKNEFYDHWKSLQIQKEFTYRMQKHASAVIQDTIKFCESLPLVLYCTIKPLFNSDKIEYFKLMPFFYKAEHTELIQDNYFASFISVFDNEFYSIAKPVNIDLNADKIRLKAIIKDILKKDEYEKMRGLRLLDVKNGIPIWTILSTAGESYRLGLKHFYESFALIEYSQKQSIWKIDSFFRDVRSKSANFELESYNFFTAKKL